MNLQLSDEEFDRIARFVERLARVRQQIQQMMQQGDELVDVINTSWRDAHQRMQLENPALQKQEIPPMVNEQGQQMVNLNTKDKRAEWQTVHDVKRVAVSEEEPENTANSDKDVGLSALACASQEKPTPGKNKENSDV